MINKIKFTKLVSRSNNSNNFSKFQNKINALLHSGLGLTVTSVSLKVRLKTLAKHPVWNMLGSCACCVCIESQLGNK